MHRILVPQRLSSALICVVTVLAALLGVRPGQPLPARAAVSVMFTSTGSEQTFVVPAG